MYNQVEVHQKDGTPVGLRKYQPATIPPNLRITTQQAEAILLRDSQTEHPATTTYLGVPILQEHSIRVLARKILMYVQFKQFCAISSVGKSGAGKTTFSGNLVHELHTLAELEFDVPFAVRWVGKKELLDFDKWLASLPHVNQILVFEDISYAMEMAKKKDKLKIKEAFTHIRHELGDVRVICIFHYHYSRAFDKMMRDSYYSVYTSMSKEEKGNLIHMHGGDKDTVEMFNKFMYRLQGMDELGYFTVPLDEKNKDKKYVYWTQNPFQIALTDQHGAFHFTMYGSPKTSDKVSCALCSPYPNAKRLKGKALMQVGCEAFGDSEFKKVARYWCYMRGGRNCLTKKERYAWHWLDDFCAQNYVDIDDFVTYVGGEMLIQGKTPNDVQHRGENKKVMLARSKDVLERASKTPHYTNKITEGMIGLFGS